MIPDSSEILGQSKKVSGVTFDMEQIWRLSVSFSASFSSSSSPFYFILSLLSMREKGSSRCLSLSLLFGILTSKYQLQKSKESSNPS
jgi:hypothetical protein